jgi:hypothetical protein
MAHAAFMNSKNLLVNPATQEERIREKRPSIPSIAPLRDANFEFGNPTAADATRLRRDTLPPLKDNAMPLVNQSDALPASLQDLRVLLSTKEYEQQIDPALLAVFHASGNSDSDRIPLVDPESVGALTGNLTMNDPNNSYTFSTVKAPFPIPTKQQTSKPTRQTATPPHLSINTATSHEGFQMHQNLVDRASMTPDSPLSPWAVATPSPSSSKSDSSELSSFPTTSTSTPATTALPTPSDEKFQLDKALAVTAGHLQPSTSAQAVCGMNFEDEN